MPAHESRILRNEVVFRTLQVTRVQRLSPHMQRITLGGEALTGFHSPSPDDHVKLFFPNTAGQLVIPRMGPDGPIHAQGVEPSPMRDYTPRLHDPEEGLLVIDFVLHGHGAAASWAAQARPGQSLGLGGPRGSFVAAADFDRYVLVGDETALPAIGRWVEQYRGNAPIVALIEIPQAEDAQVLATPPQVELHWLPRDGADAASSTLLEQALRDLMALQPPTAAGDTFYWIAAESRRARAMRQYLSEECGVPKDWLRATGYWKRGASEEE